MPNGENWFDDYVDEIEEVQIEEYDITAAPNDFNVSTIFSFLEAGSVRVPGFQRNFVWDLGRSSKLVESLSITVAILIDNVRVLRRLDGLFARATMR